MIVNQTITAMTLVNSCLDLARNGAREALAKKTNKIRGICNFWLHSVYDG